MSQQCSWPTHSGPLEGRCPHYALLGLTQAPGFAGGPDLLIDLLLKKWYRKILYHFYLYKTNYIKMFEMI